MMIRFTSKLLNKYSNGIFYFIKTIFCRYMSLIKGTGLIILMSLEIRGICCIFVLQVITACSLGSRKVRQPVLGASQVTPYWVFGTNLTL